MQLLLPHLSLPPPPPANINSPRPPLLSNFKTLALRFVHSIFLTTSWSLAKIWPVVRPVRTALLVIKHSSPPASSPLVTHVVRDDWYTVHMYMWMYSNKNSMFFYEFLCGILLVLTFSRHSTILSSTTPSQLIERTYANESMVDDYHIAKVWAMGTYAPITSLFPSLFHTQLISYCLDTSQSARWCNVHARLNAWGGGKQGRGTSR